MTTELPGLECKGIAKSFGGVPVLKDVSLTLELGTVTALVGENGAGKSTLLKIASGQLSPDAGEILVRGERLPFGDPRASHRLILTKRITSAALSPHWIQGEGAPIQPAAESHRPAPPWGNTNGPIGTSATQCYPEVFF